MAGWLVAVAVVVLLWLVAIATLVALGRRETALEVATLIPNLVALFRGLLRDPRVATSSKVLVWVAIVWLVSPIDLIPEFIPIAGPLDDIIVAGLVLRYVARRSDPAAVEEHWRGEPSTLDAMLRQRREA